MAASVCDLAIPTSKFNLAALKTSVKSMYNEIEGDGFPLPALVEVLGLDKLGKTDLLGVTICCVWAKLLAINGVPKERVNPRIRVR